MTSPELSGEESTLKSHGYRITVDEGRESFYAMCLEDPNNTSAWLMSDTVRALENMR